MSQGPAVPVVASSRIVAATLYSESAHVTRRLALELPAGRVRIALDDLPAALDPGALRVRTTLGSVRAVEAEVLDRAPDATTDTAALRAAVAALRGEALRLGGELEALRLELELLDQLSPAPLVHPSGATTPAPLRPAAFLAGLELVTRRRGEAARALRAAEAELGATTEALATTERRLALVGETAGAAGRAAAVVVTLDVPEPGAAMLDLTYELGWATWRPYYQLRASARDGTVECQRFADLWQETGEDWVEVELRLSTAEPEAGLLAPNVLPWTLGLAKGYEDQVAELYRTRRAPAPARAVQKIAAPPPMASAPVSPAAPYPGAPLPRGRGALFGAGGGGPPPAGAPVEDGAAAAMPEEDFEVCAQQLEEEGAFASTTASGAMTMPGLEVGTTPPTSGAAAMDADAPLPRPPGRTPHRGPSGDHPDLGRLAGSGLPRDTSGGLDFERTVGGRATCRSGKERQRVSLGSVVYPAKLEYLLRPALKDHAYARVTVVNAEAEPLLAGPAGLYAGDAFFGQTALATTPPGGALVLELGAETAIKAARRSRTTVRTAGILTKEDIHGVEVTIEVESFLGRTVELEVEDQVPLSRDAKVEVRLVRTTPKDAELDPLTGVVRFRVRVASGVKVELGLVYELQVPKDYQLHQRLDG